MQKSLLIGLVALVVGVSAAAFAWRAYTPPVSEVAQAPVSAEAAAAAPPQVVADAPSSKGIFPKVLNH